MYWERDRANDSDTRERMRVSWGKGKSVEKKRG